jgi:large subunit ribosomal protein L18
MATKKDLRRLRIKREVRNKISGSSELPRLSVFKSNSAIYAQIIDDVNGQTLASATSFELKKSKNINIDQSKEVGKKLAEKAVANGIEKIIFDRNGYLYHGKVKALADGAREGGLKF